MGHLNLCGRWIPTIRRDRGHVGNTDLDAVRIVWRIDTDYFGCCVIGARSAYWGSLCAFDCFFIIQLPMKNVLKSLGVLISICFGRCVRFFSYNHQFWFSSVSVVLVIAASDVHFLFINFLILLLVITFRNTTLTFLIKIKSLLDATIVLIKSTIFRMRTFTGGYTSSVARKVCRARICLLYLPLEFLGATTYPRWIECIWGIRRPLRNTKVISIKWFLSGFSWLSPACRVLLLR